MDSNTVTNPSLEPLRERSDYAAQGLDQLERQFVNLPADEKDLIEDQFKDRLKRKSSMNSNIEKIANDILANENKCITIKTNYKEKNGEPLLEEYIVDKNGDTKTYDNIHTFIQRMNEEGLL